jgi:hypothetical protein
VLACCYGRKRTCQRRFLRPQELRGINLRSLGSSWSIYRPIRVLLKQNLGKKLLYERVNLANYQTRGKSLQTSWRRVVKSRVRTLEKPAAINSMASVPIPPLEEFFLLFRDDNDCLEFLWRSRLSADGKSARCPECGDAREFWADLSKMAHLRWQCVACGCFLSPIAGTIFQKSRTPIHVYFDAIGVLGEPGRPVQVEELAYELGIPFTTAAEVMQALEGRLDTRDSSSPRFAFEISVSDELARSY